VKSGLGGGGAAALFIMPVRIYEIAKKLGMESKEVLVHAKDLGISAAKVPSSSLDKITAEYLEEEIQKTRPANTTRPEPTEGGGRRDDSAPEPDAQESAQPEPEPEPEPEAEPVEAEEKPAKREHRPAAAGQPEPEPEPQPAPEPAKEAAQATESQKPAAEERAPQRPPEPSLEEPAPDDEPAAEEPQSEGEQPVSEEQDQAESESYEPVSAKSEPPAETKPAAPAAPSKPGLGEKVGFIKLPPKPGPKIGDKVGSVKLPPKPAPKPAQDSRPGQGNFQRPQGPGGNQQRGQGYQQGNFRQGGGQNRPGGFQRPGGFGQNRGFQQRPPLGRTDNRAPSEPRFVPPVSGELIVMKPPIIVRDLAERLKRKPFQLIADLMAQNVFANVNQAIDELVAQKICAKYGFRFEIEKRERGAGVGHQPIVKIDVEPDDKPEDLKPRAPVVTIMGHVDHGKTTLLDVIRKSDVVTGEAGGITQHIGAYTISIPHPENPKVLKQITFLDTPGHAAFSAMRARGANVTDIVVLVVAANDGVMPQTMEALSHARAAKVPIIVAVNKVDHPNSTPVKVRQQLQEKGLSPEEWGGETIFQDVSALTKLGVDKLLELLVLQADIMELKANPDRAARGNVIESGLLKGGPTATVLVRNGTLNVGDIIISGQYYGRVKALVNEDGKQMKAAGPSHAVKVLGLNGVPEAGLEFSVMDNEKEARILAEERAQAEKTKELERRPKVTLENLFDTLASEQNKVLKVVVKADTQGSVEAIVDALRKIDSSKVSLDVIHSAVGTITESDVVLSSASKAIILGFHTRIDNGVSDAAKREGVQVKLYAIIYELIDQVKEAMAGLLDPLLKEIVVGQAEVRQIFELSKGGKVAGCVVISGRLVKGKMRVMRRKGLIYEGVSHTLRRFQDEVNEVRSGMECGIRLDGFDDFQAGDMIECYNVEKVAQLL